jgi:transposase
MHPDCIRRFLGIPDHSIRNVSFLDDQGVATTADGRVATVLVVLARTTRRFSCRCGRQFAGYYDCQERLVRDLPWGPWAKVWLVVPRFRVKCPACGVRTEPLGWLAPRCRYTQRLAGAVTLACQEVRSILAIAESFQLSWDTVKDLDKAALEAKLNPPDFRGVRHLALDEFSLRRRHTYGTIFLDAERCRVLWVCRTREKEAVNRVFTEVFGPAVCRQIEAVTMDWWDGYAQAVAECLPHAAVVWDKFHVVKKYNLDVLDRVRVDEASRCHAQPQRLALKKTKFILLKNRHKLTGDEPARLATLLAVNQRLCRVYILRDALRQLWEYHDPTAAANWFRGWYHRAIRSRIEPLKRFARSMRNRLHGVLAHCRFPLHTGMLEGVNNKVKVIKRVAYGFRDQDYFFLKIRGQFNQATPY